MGSRSFDFCASIVIFFIIGVILVVCDAAHYMKKDHSLIKPYAGVSKSSVIILFAVALPKYFSILNKFWAG